MQGSTIFVLFSLVQFALLAAHISEGQVCPASALSPVHAGVNMLQQSTSHPTEVMQAVNLKVDHRSPKSGPGYSEMSQLAVNGSAKGAPGGESIFKLKVKELDSDAYNMIFAAMIFFTILVDRCQAYITAISQTSVVESRLVNRVTSELMMFGCVGVGIFVMTNIWDVPAKWSLFLTHVDIYASLAAVLMIFISIMLYFMNRWVLPKVANMKSDHGESAILHSAKTNRFNLFQSFHQNKMQIVASTFTADHSLPVGVNYMDYLSECFILNACDIMDIHWTSWIIIFLISVVTEVELHFRPDHAQDKDLSYYIAMYCGTNYFFFACNLVIFFDVNSSYNKMMKYLEAVDNGEEVEMVKPMPGQTPERLKHGMQIVTLCNSFQVALFVMTWIYNLSIIGASWKQYVFMLLPCLLGTLVLLPITVFAFTIVDSFYEPNSDALDTLFEHFDRLEDDLTYLGRIYERKGRPKIPELEGGCDKEKLEKVLRHLGLHVSSTRMHRIFQKFDKDGDGQVDSAEFFDRIAIAGSESLASRSMADFRASASASASSSTLP
mmetsp:Transcript_77279/g.145705  ORF Transcript_77279/g.145705 Transcript_77279/m.145705 type:complete len:550 (+) Transcript_77279:107-1756(+)